MTKERILNFLREHKQEFQEKYSVTKIVLFGSYARDEARDDSDIDISVETPLDDPFKLVHLKEELSTALKKPIDIIRFRTNMNPYLKQHILKDGIYA